MGEDIDRRIVYQGKGETQLMNTTTSKTKCNSEGIVKLLEQNPEISAWTLSEEVKSSTELFLIQDRLDMNRSAETHEFFLCVYKDFEEDGVRYKGKASCTIGISDSEREIAKKIDDALFSAGFVKNQWYDLPVNAENRTESLRTYANLNDLKKRFQEIHRTLFADYGFDSKVNSCEIFAVEGSKRVLTSKGTDVAYPFSEFTFEVVTDCNTGEEPVEIFNGYYLTRIDMEQIREIVIKQLSETEGRSLAKRNPKLENQRIVLSGNAVEELLQYYLSQASDSWIYMGISLAKIGERFLGETAKEALNIRMNPTLDCSIDASPVDSEGKILKPYVLYKDGAVENIRTAARFSHYLNIENIGYCSTFEADGGNTKLSEYLKEDHIEILAFSSFNVDHETGDFGGEFRLAKMVKNGVVSYLTGGSISENILKVQDRMRFSKETENRRYSKAPKAIIIDGVTVAGE